MQARGARVVLLQTWGWLTGKNQYFANYLTMQARPLHSWAPGEKLGMYGGCILPQDPSVRLSCELKRTYLLLHNLIHHLL